MALETAQYINQLNPSNPPGADRVHQGDDHIRIIKAVLKNTFPNITGPVTKTQEELNSPFSMPPGVIVAWYGDTATVPTGWGICDGSSYQKADGVGTIATPDLRNRSIMGAGSTVAFGATAGALLASANTGSAGEHTHAVESGGAHSHTGTVANHTLTENQIPQHKHANGVCDNSSTIYNHGTTSASPTTSGAVESNGATGSTEGYTTDVGGGQPHSHGLVVDSGGAHTHSTAAGGAHTHALQVGTLHPVGGLHYIMKL